MRKADVRRMLLVLAGGLVDEADLKAGADPLEVAAGVLRSYTGKDVHPEHLPTLFAETRSGKRRGYDVSDRMREVLGGLPWPPHDGVLSGGGGPGVPRSAAAPPAGGSPPAPGGSVASTPCEYRYDLAWMDSPSLCGDDAGPCALEGAWPGGGDGWPPAPEGATPPAPRGEVLPHGGEVLPHGGEVLPHGGELFPHGGEVLPHGGELFPRGAPAPGAGADGGLRTFVVVAPDMTFWIVNASDQRRDGP